MLYTIDALICCKNRLFVDTNKITSFGENSWSSNVYFVSSLSKVLGTDLCTFVYHFTNSEGLYWKCYTGNKSTYKLYMISICNKIIIIDDKSMKNFFQPSNCEHNIFLYYYWSDNFRIWNIILLHKYNIYRKTIFVSVLARFQCITRYYRLEIRFWIRNILFLICIGRVLIGTVISYSKKRL